MSVSFSAPVMEALRAQLAARASALAAGARPLGWKIAASIPGVPPDDGAGGLIFGHLTSDTAIKAGGSFRRGTTVQLCAEVELAVVIGRDVQPDTDLEMARCLRRRRGSR